MTSVLECRDLDAGYAGSPVVRGLNLSLDAGEVVALLGPNGAGKTTTLLTLAGVLEPLGGSVTVFGHRAPHGRPHLLSRQGLALVPDDRSLFTTLTTRENLAVASRTRDSIEEALRYFPALVSRLDVLAGLLSGGEQQMLALARALVSRPRLLLVDEMSLGLAPTLLQKVLPMVRRIAEQTGAAVLLVEQHIELALRVADRAVVLVHGEVALEGRAASLLADRERIEASYLGARRNAAGMVP
jgi:branched-chain amino acid transport system ATP-binding protein